MDDSKIIKTNFSKPELKKIRDAIVNAQKRREFCIIDGSDADKLETLINQAFLASFGIDLFGTDD